MATNTYVEYVEECKDAECGFRKAGGDPVGIIGLAATHAECYSHPVQVKRHEVAERAVAAIDFRQ